MNPTIRRRCLGVLSGLALWLPTAVVHLDEGEAVTLKSRYQKGDKISAEDSSKFSFGIRMNTGMEGVGTMKIDMEAESESGYLTELVRVDEERGVEQELREYTRARARTKTTMEFGDTEEEVPAENKTLPIEGQSFLLTREDDGVKVVPKGSAKDLSKSDYAALSIHEGVDKLLPEGPVRKGDRWSVEGKKLKEWLQNQMEAVKAKDVDGSFECTLKQVEQAEGKRIALVEVQFDLEFSMDPKAMAASAGEEEEEDDEERVGPKVKIDMTMRMKKGRGEFLFSIDEAMALSASFSAKMEVEMTQEIGDMELEGKGTGRFESMVKWKLEEREEGA